MTSWPSYRLNELGFVGRGRSTHRPRDHPSLYGGDTPFFQTGDVKAASFWLRDHRQTYNATGLAQSKLWPRGTLCITIAANIAETAVLAVPGAFPDSVVGFLADPERTDVRFVKYSLDTLRAQMQGISRGTTQDNLSLDKLLSFSLKVPPLPEQRRIAGILSAYDDLIENCERRIRVLEKMARTLYYEWFVGFRYPGHEKVPIVESALGRIPKEWTCAAFTDLADVLSGGTPRTDVSEFWDGAIPFFTPRDAPDCCYVRDTEKHLSEVGLAHCASSLFSPDTVFITARGTVGRLALASRSMAMNQSCYALRARAPYSQRFLYLLVLQQVEYLKRNTGGATFDTIVVDTFRRMRIIAPSRAVATQFSRLVDPFFDGILNVATQAANLRKTRDLLLPRLLSGQLPVSPAA